ncbi:MAG: hypothetical protein JO281_19245 [Pseudonocardiales bacterium]|nr:hypothetical protein [Pseudonocardiales bacterium]
MSTLFIAAATAGLSWSDICCVVVICYAVSDQLVIGSWDEVIPLVK